MTERTVRVPDEETSRTARVLLLVENDRNRELLADQLRESFEVRTSESDPFADPQFDVCLVDTPSLREYDARLQETKTAAAPTFLPCLLLAGRAPDDLPTDVWGLVDEVIQRPMSRAALDVRLSNLLERRRLSLELTRQKEQSQERFESLFRSIPDPVVVITPDGTITGANEAFTRTFGLDRDAVTGQPIPDLEPSTGEPVERVLLRIAEGEHPETATQWSLGGEDPFITELNTDTVVGLGEVAERIGIFRDITQRVEREEELERQNERLEEFADVIAHDLRNPLNVARAQLDVVRETGEERHFDVIDRAQGRMEQMIDELLVLAKQGRAVLDPAPISLEAAVERAWRHVGTSAATLEVDVDRSDVIVADEGRLSELLENLIRNSVEHSSTSPPSQAQEDSVEHSFTGSRAKPDDSVEHGARRASARDAHGASVEHGSAGSRPQSGDVTEGTSTSNQHPAGAGDAVDPGGETVAVRIGTLGENAGFYIEDDGPGIPPEKRDEVFEAGYTDASDGTGLGLSIVRRIVDGHGWTVSITDSELGGVRFEISDVEFD